MSFLFNLTHKDATSLSFITEYMCEEAKCNRLLQLALQSFYILVDKYKRYNSEFTLYVSNNDEYDRFGKILYEIVYCNGEEKVTIGDNTNEVVYGKYFLAIDIEIN